MCADWLVAEISSHSVVDELMVAEIGNQPVVDGLISSQDAADAIEPAHCCHAI